MLLLVAHNGRTLDLDVQGSTRVDAVQHALTSLSGVSLQDQIVICAGTRLDPSKTLSMYGLPHSAAPQEGEGTGSDKDGNAKPSPEVFLYRRSLLRPDSEPPLPEAIPEIVSEEPPEPMGAACPHPLDDPGLSPLVRALPGLERLFRHHLAVAQAYWGASQERYRICQRLLSEQEVQSMAIDAARANVEVHYTYICKTFSSFMEKYTALQQAQREVLLNFERDMAALAATELHPAAVGNGRRFLIDLVPKERLEEWAENCREAREQFAVKVADLEAIFAGLRSEVEALFMTSPSVDLDELGRRMEEVHGQLDVEASIMQCFEKDLGSVCKVVEESVRQLAANPSGAVEPGDTCTALERINITHVDHLLPQIKACDKRMTTFHQECADCKNQMSYDVHQQLKQISAQQSRIRDMRNKLAVFQEVASKQGQLFSELCLVARIPAAYRASLAEVVRRRAFHELYAGQAAQLAERMAALRDREARRHESFRQLVEEYMPSDLLTRLGLKLPPPLCEVNIPLHPDGNLPELTVEDIKAVPRESKPSQLVAHVFGEWLPKDPPKQTEKEKQTVPSAKTELTYEELQLQNARLRADFAAQKAASHLSHLRADPLSLLAMSASASSVAKAAQGAVVSSAVGGNEAPNRSQQFKNSTAALGASTSVASEEVCKRGQHATAVSSKEAAFSDALAAKDFLIQQLEAKLEAEKAQIAGLSSRVVALEGQASSIGSAAALPTVVTNAQTTAGGQAPGQGVTEGEPGSADVSHGNFPQRLRGSGASPTAASQTDDADAAVLDEPRPVCGSVTQLQAASGPSPALLVPGHQDESETDETAQGTVSAPAAEAEDVASDDNLSPATSDAKEVAVESSVELPEPSEAQEGAPESCTDAKRGSHHRGTSLASTLDAPTAAADVAGSTPPGDGSAVVAEGETGSQSRSSVITPPAVGHLSDDPGGHGQHEEVLPSEETATVSGTVVDAQSHSPEADTHGPLAPDSPGVHSDTSAMEQSFGTADGGSDNDGSEEAAT